MSKFLPTKQQEFAINSNGEILVSASAGSGKTAVLVERVISKIIDSNNPIDADKFLIVTFTKAAANELKGRISLRLSEEIAKNPNNFRLAKQRMLINLANIGTIDSFCLKIIKDYFQELDIDPDFKIIDGSSEQTILKECIDKVFLQYFNDENSDFLAFVDCFDGIYSDENAKKVILETYYYAQNQAFFDRFLSSAKEIFKENVGFEIWIKSLNKEYIRVLNGYKKDIESVLSSISFINGSEKLVPYADNLTDIIDKYVDVLNKDSYKEIKDGLAKINSEINFLRIPTIKEPEAPVSSAIEYFKTVKENIKKIASNDLFGLYFYDEKTVIKNADNISRIVNMLVEITSLVNKEFINRLKNESLMNFRLASRLLLQLLVEYKDGQIVKTKHYSQIVSKFCEVLVDEYQDTDDLQDILYYYLSDEGKNLFIVGDLKQSIYGFRGGNSKNFKQKQINSKLLTEKNLNENYSRKVYLTNNFRSKKEICEFANRVFGLIMSDNVGDTSYGSTEALVPKKEFPKVNENAVEIDILNKSDNNIDSNEEFGLYLADKINELTSKEAFLSSNNGKLRKAEYKDIAILVRKSIGIVDTVTKVLDKKGIPTIEISDKPLISSEVVTLVSFLKVLNNKNDEIALISVLTSPIFGFDFEEIMTFKTKYDISLYKCLTLEAKSGNIKCKKAIEFFKKIENLSYLHSVSEIIEIILRLTYFKQIVTSLPGGNYRAKNIDEFIRFAKGFNTSFDGYIYSFLNSYEAIKESYTVKNELNTDCDAVKIITIHNSKGLQFPICIVDVSHDIINRNEKSAIVNFDSNLGIGFNYYNKNKNIIYPTFSYEAIKRNTEKATRDEEMRLLYVAFTRAEEKLIIVSRNPSKKSIKSTANIVDSLGAVQGCKRVAETASNVSSWVLSTVLTTDESNTIRSLYELSEISNGHCGLFSVKIKTINLKEDNGSNFASSSEKVSYNSDILDEINNRFNYSYPYSKINSLEAKTSVSALTKKDASKKYAFTSIPSFVTKFKLTNTEMGTALHKFMQHADFYKAKSNLSEELERLYEWKFLSAEEINSLNKESINIFLSSELLKRMLKSDKVLREERFMLDINAREIDKSLDERYDDEKIIIQGAVDCAFFEEDGIVLIDFKTDRISKKEDLISLYKEQLEYYSMALKKIYGKNVKECHLYSTYLNEDIII